jgi:hypothetical protein
VSPELDISSLSLEAEPKASNKAVTVSSHTLDLLIELSLSASSDIRFATQTQEWIGEEEWKSRLTFHDIWRICAALEVNLEKQGKGFTVLRA